MELDLLEAVSEEESSESEGVYHIAYNTFEDVSGISDGSDY